MTQLTHQQMNWALTALCGISLGTVLYAISCLFKMYCEYFRKKP